MKQTSSARSRAAVGVTAGAVSAAGLDIVREVGVENLTMRRVADRLGVRAPTLYHYVVNRDALLDAVVERAFADLDDLHQLYEQVQTTDGWVTAATTATTRVRAWYHLYPGLADTVLRRGHALPAMSAGQRITRCEVDALVRAGVPMSVARHISRVQSSWSLYAVAAEESRRDLEPDELDRIWTDGLRALTQGLIDAIP